MNALVLLHRDRRRAQRGSVLSGVLIITAFIAIIAGAMSTELSGSFLLSRDLMTRLANEAAVNSSLELAIDSAQNAPMTTACPGLRQAPTLNGVAVSSAYLGCALITDNSPAAGAMGSSKPIAQDGAFVSLPGLLPGSGTEYLVADSGGMLYGHPFGSTAGWTISVGGTPTAAPMAMPAGDGAVADLVPVSTSGGNYGVALVIEPTPGQPSLSCTMISDASVIASPGAGRSAPNTAYFGDTVGTVYALDASSGGQCSELDETTVAGGRPVVAGPLVYPASGSRDRLFFIVSDGTSSTLEQYRFSRGSQNLQSVSSLALPAGNAVGMTADSTSLPARIAITFAGGQVAMVQVSASFAMTVTENGSLPVGGVGAPPTWCLACLGGSGLIGVGSTSGLYLLDTNLNVYSWFTRAALATAPAVDAGGDWFAGGDNGNLYELQSSGQGLAMTVAHAFPAAGDAITSSPVASSCPQGFCVYFGSADSHAYLVALDARELTISACVWSQDTCTAGAKPRLWAHVIVGTSGNPRAVHMLGFSYYSP